MIEEKECLSRRGGGGGGLATEMDEGLDLPPGFRFHPTDEELITYYLIPKILNDCFCARAIGEADLNKCEPWDLPRRAKMGEKESYFFCVRDRKYPTGSRTNRATDAGYWKATGKDREIQRLKKVVGMKKTLVFYRGRAPKGQKTNWVMHEFRLEESYSKHNLLNTEKDDWVICRVIQKKPDGTRADLSAGSERLSSYGNGLGASPLILPPLVDSSPVASWPNQLNNPTVLQGTMSRHETLLSAPSSSSNPSLFPARASLACPDAVSMKEHSILRMLIENDDATYLKTEAFLGADFSRDLLLPAMDQGRMHMPFEHPLSAHGQGDVDWFGVIEAGDTA